MQYVALRERSECTFGSGCVIEQVNFTGSGWPCQSSSGVASFVVHRANSSNEYVPSSVVARTILRVAAASVSVLLRAQAPAPNPSIERTFQRPLRALWPAAHVER